VFPVRYVTAVDSEGMDSPSERGRLWQGRGVPVYGASLAVLVAPLLIG